MAFWHDLITEKSWQVLQEMRGKYDFVLIGGWAVYLYARSLKSKDIDVVVDYESLARLKDAYPALRKNERLRKYEIPLGEFDVDIYVPHYSDPGLPAEVILSETRRIENFRIPSLEALLIMKGFAAEERRGTAKGQKDRLDLLSLLSSGTVNWDAYRTLSARHRPESPEHLREFLKGVRSAPEIGLNPHRLSRLKSTWLKQL